MLGSFNPSTCGQLTTLKRQPTDLCERRRFPTENRSVGDLRQLTRASTRDMATPRRLHLPDPPPRTSLRASLAIPVREGNTIVLTSTRTERVEVSSGFRFAAGALPESAPTQAEARS